jgi:MATE family multidrug resistance protein
LNKKILKLAFPNIISNLSVPLIGLVDTALSGHLGDAAHLAGLALGSTIFSFIFWGFGFLRMGTTGLTAQAWGAKDEERLQAIFFRATLVAIFGGLFLWLTQIVMGNMAFWLFKGSAEAENWARIYFETRIWAAPATLMIYVINGWSLGAQNAILPLGVTLVQNVGNAVLSLVFVLHYDMGIQGVALGTVIGNYAAAIFGGIWMAKKYSWLFVLPKKAWLSITELTAFFKLNSDLVIRTLALIATFTWFTAESATYGDVPLAANTILLQLWMIFSYGIDGFAFAAESLVGALKGGKNHTDLALMIKRCFQWGIGLGILGGLLFYLFQQPIITLFTNDLPTINFANNLYPWILVAPLIGSFCYIWDGIFIGLTASAAMRNSMLIAVVAVYFPVYFLLESSFGISALWMAMMGFLGARALGLWWYYRKRFI